MSDSEPVTPESKEPHATPGDQTANGSDSNPNQPSVGTDPAAALEDGPPANSAAAAPGGEEFQDYEELTPELVEDEAIRGDFVLRWAVVLMAFLFGATLVADSRGLVQIASGRYLATHGLLPPAHDPLAATTAERSWINLSWGLDLLSAGVYALGGFVGISLIKAILSAILLAGIVHAADPRVRTWWHAVCGALALVACQTQLHLQPELITLLGATATLTLLTTHRRGAGTVWPLWLVFVLFVVWANLDPRAWIGPAILLFSAVGRSVFGPFFPRSDAASVPTSTIYQWFGVAAMALLVHPFTYHSLLSPLSTYTHDYPAFRDFLMGARPVGPIVGYYPIWTDSVWREWSFGLIAVCTLWLSTLVTFWLNRRQLDAGDLLLFCGMTAVGVVATRELPVLAVVCAILAGLNGQAWFSSSGPKVYGLSTGELLVVRGGRAVTVLALTLLAFIGATGRLTTTVHPPTGFGLDLSLSESLAGMTDALAGCPDERIYNYRPAQGDLLIWLGKKPFLDRRLPVYYGIGEQNLIALHHKVMFALRRGDPKQEGTGQRDLWKTVFDRFQIQTVMPQTGAFQGPGAGINYPQIIDLAAAPADWQMTYLGALAAVFVRTETESPEQKQFLKEHRLDFAQRAYHPEKPIPLTRDQFPAPRSTYQQLLWPERKWVPNEIREGQLLVELSREPLLPAAWQRNRHALAVLGLRKLQQGLIRAPQLPEGYMSLGQAQLVLANYDGGVPLPNLGFPPVSVRYFLAVAAFRQAALLDPQNEAAHRTLMQLYQSGQRPDLALAEAHTVESLLNAARAKTPQDEQVLREQRAAIIGLRVKLAKEVAALQDSLKQFAADNPEPMAQAQFAAQNRLLLTTFKLLDDNKAKFAGDINLKLTYALLLLEQGRIEDASYELQLLEETAKRSGFANWREPSAVAFLAMGNYEQALLLLGDARRTLDQLAVRGLLDTLPPRGSSSQGALWPLNGLAVGFATLATGPDTTAKLQSALGIFSTEWGNTADAIAHFRRLGYSDAPRDYRAVAGFYLRMLTGEEIEQIPILFEPEPQE